MQLSARLYERIREACQQLDYTTTPIRPGTCNGMAAAGNHPSTPIWLKMSPDQCFPPGLHSPMFDPLGRRLSRKNVVLMYRAQLNLKPHTAVTTTLFSPRKAFNQTLNRPYPHTKTGGQRSGSGCVAPTTRSGVVRFARRSEKESRVSRRKSSVIPI